MTRFPRAALVGTGYLGGSLLLALRRARLVGAAVGYDADAAAAFRATTRGIVDAAAGDSAAAARGAQLVVLAVPVGAMAEAARAIAPALDGGAIVVDVGSTKRAIVDALEPVLGGRFVGCHPIAGREHRGPDAADPELFRDRPCLLTPTARTDGDALAAAETLWQAVGARTMRLDPAQHDLVMALTSHLPHVASFALAGALDEALDGEPAFAAIAPSVAGASVADTTRVAASSATLWAGILAANREALLPLVDLLSNRLGELRGALAQTGAGDEGERRRGEEALARWLARGNRGRARVVPPR